MGVGDHPLDPFGWVGATVAGKYRVDAVVAEGGFGVVYRAHHMGFDAAIALKCLKLPARLQGAGREDFLRAFVEEGRLLHQLSRATVGIVQAMDVGADTSPNGTWTPYLALEWLDGQTLEEDLAARATAGLPGRTLTETIALLEPAARALAVAHERGIAHRDIKPANLFVTNLEGRQIVKVVDFGIAKVMTEVTSLTRALQATGASLQAFTPQYGAPEQFDRASYGATGPWSDVFALALVIVEVLTGRPALDGGDTTQLFIASVHPGRRPTPRQCGVHVPDAVEAVMARAVAIEPRDRFHSAGEFWDALVAAASRVSSHEAFAATALGQVLPQSKRTELAPPGSLPAASWPRSPSTTSPHVGQPPGLVPPAPPLRRRRSLVPTIAMAAAAIGVLAIATVGALALWSHSTPGQGSVAGASARSPLPTTGASNIARPPPADITLSCVTSTTASSWYEKHPAGHAFDENPKTAWNENAPGDGTGEWVEARLKPNTYVDYVDVGGGWSWTTDDKTDLWPLNNSFRTMRVSWEGGSTEVQFNRKSDRGRKKRVIVGAVTSSIRLTAVAVDRGKVDDLSLDDALIFGSCPLDCAGEASDCADDLFVQIGGSQSGTAADYGYPGAFDMLRGRPEFQGVRVVEARHGGARVMGAIVKNRCLATKLSGLVHEQLALDAVTVCEKVAVSREVWSIPQGGLPVRAVAETSSARVAAPHGPVVAPATMIHVPAGTFTMGSDEGALDGADADAGPNPRAPRRVTISRGFSIDKTEVTVTAYQACVEAGGCTPSGIHGAGVPQAAIDHYGPMCNAGDPARAQDPINCIDRMQAATYCMFVGKRLPTEAEWEYAARGTDARPYPWGSTEPTCEMGAFRQGTAQGRICRTDQTRTVPVGSFPLSASPFGALDMAGNVWEWVDDGWDKEAQAHTPAVDPHVALSGPMGVLRGGSWDFVAKMAESFRRLPFKATDGQVSTGVRCVKSD